MSINFSNSTMPLSAELGFCNAAPKSPISSKIVLEKLYAASTQCGLDKPASIFSRLASSIASLARSFGASAYSVASNRNFQIISGASVASLLALFAMYKASPHVKSKYNEWKKDGFEKDAVHGYEIKELKNGTVVIKAPKELVEKMNKGLEEKQPKGFFNFWG